MNHKIVISVNTAWNIYNFRPGLVRALVDHGYDVVAVTPYDEYASRLDQLGCRFVGLPMDNHGTNPGRDMLLLMRYLHLLRSERPSVFLGYTIKPNVYGSLAANILGIPVINNIAGLGMTFVSNNLLTRIVRGLYKCGLYGSARIFFQNAEDQELFIRAGLVRSEVTDRLPGSGIDLTRYLPTPPLPMEGRGFRFLLVARMLKQKGIREFVEAARIVRRQCPETEFQLLGFADKADKHAIPPEEIRGWQDEGLVRYFGRADDVRPYLTNSDCIVLPSEYREGVPRCLLEAAATARPIIATDAVGCRDIVEDKVNGLLCPVRDVQTLAQKMTQMLDYSPAERLAMGLAGRRKVEAQFDEKIVIQKYLGMITQVLQENARREKAKTALAMRSK